MSLSGSTGIRAVALTICIFVSVSLFCQVNPLLTRSKDDKPPTSTVSRRWYRSIKIYQNVIALQKKIQERISELISAGSEDKKGGRIAGLIFGSFFYGFIHALGPGHRKVVLSYYIIGERSFYGTAALTAFLIALVHAGSAVILIFGLYALVSGPIMGKFTDFTLDITRVSYFLLAAIGLVLIGTNLIGQKKDRKTVPLQGAVKKGNRLLFIIASGAVPCPGAAAVLVFGIANEAPGLGVVAALSMSAGMAVLLVAVVMATVFLKTALLKERRNRKKSSRRVTSIIENVLEITGGAIISAFGLLMLLPS